MESLTERTARAVPWRFAGSVVGAVSQIAIGVVLARLLTPTDFGVVALAFIILGLVQPLGDLGIGNAVVQRAQLTDRHVRAAFTLSVLASIFLAAALALAAPLGALVTKDSHVTPVVRLLSLGFALSGTAVVARALLRRQLDFRRLFFIESGSFVLGYGGVAISLAALGHGAWSLVWGGLCQSLLASGAQIAAVRHPLRPLLARRELADLLDFGLGSSASACVNYVALNADYFVVGRGIGAAGLGLYTRAYTLMNLPTAYGASVLSSVLFPALARLQNEPARLGRAYLLLTQLTAMLAAPPMAILAIAAPHLVPSLYGSPWVGAVAPLQVLCMAGYFRALYHLGGVVAQSVGWVYRELRRQAVYAVLVIAGALVGVRYGLSGVAAGVAVAILYMFIASGQLALAATRTSWMQYLRVQAGSWITAAVTCAVALSVRWLLEARDAPAAVIALGVVTAASVPWCVGLLLTVGEPGFEPIRALLPAWCGRLTLRSESTPLRD